MCGIVGYIGKENATNILLDGLSHLEYRGYDSSGIAVRQDNNPALIVKAEGKLTNLSSKLSNMQINANCGIGHTRWATHGIPSEINAHPHKTDNASIIGVHNGIIENFDELKNKLLDAGYTFYSQTDTEVFIKLIDYYYKKYQGTPVDAINHSIVRIKGSYAVALMFKDYPNEIFVAKKESPMVLAYKNGECYLASDFAAILDYTNKFYLLDNMELAKLSKNGIKFYNLDGAEIKKGTTTVNWNNTSAEKQGYEHFMLKEIHEQPQAITNTLSQFIENENIKLDIDFMSNIDKLYIVACGSAYHVGVSAKYIIETLCNIPVEVDIASEFRYRNPIFLKNSCVLVVSQSGETADTIAALKLARKKNVKTAAIVNVLGSTIAREADWVMYTQAGPEIAVATTKAYSTQLICIYILAIALGKKKNLISKSQEEKFIDDLKKLPDKINQILNNKKRIQWFASKFASSGDVFFLGRGLDYSIALEASLKLKEITYIHSEAYPAGELKHGTISLIEDGVLTIGCMTQDALFKKTKSNMLEVRARGGYLAGVTFEGNLDIEDCVDFAIYIPKTNEIFSTSLAIVPLQLFAYYLSCAKGLDVDKPRNLAKSVTVE